MKQKELFKLLDEIQETDKEIDVTQRVILIDGLNLFFRNFAMLNMVNIDGAHIGGLGGFFRSLGALIKQIQPTSVYVVFDGMGSANNRKNIIPEYKSGRNLQRITNWDVFENLDEEDDAKFDQIVRIIQYLKTLPVKTVSIDKVEADDIIAYFSKAIPKDENDKVFIVSSDKDFIQLINKNVIVFRPTEKEYYTTNTVFEKYGMPAYNFIIYKTLLGDNSDKVKGVKGLGEKSLLKKFPELTDKLITLEDIYEISKSKLKEHIVYARIVQGIEDLENNYLVMDLSNPMLDENEKVYLDGIIESDELNYMPDQFLRMYNDDKLGGIIRGVELWIRDIFKNLIKQK